MPVAHEEHGSHRATEVDMISATCSCCGLRADEHHEGYPDGAGWFCADCMPGPKGHAVAAVNDWQAVMARGDLTAAIPRHGSVLPFRLRRRAALRGAA